MTTAIPIGIVVILVLLALLSSAVKIAREYERGVVFLLGRLLRAKGPGVILLIPMVDRMLKIDLRVVKLARSLGEVGSDLDRRSRGRGLRERNSGGKGQERRACCAQASHPRPNSSPSWVGLMLPPLHTMFTRRPANRSGSRSTAASAAAST